MSSKASCRIALAAALGCGAPGDAQVLYESWLDDPGARQPAFLAFSSAYAGVGPAPLDAPNFPQRLSETGAFADVARLEPVSGVVPYDIQVPLWSDGAYKRRWVMVPEGSAIRYDAVEPFEVPAGTVLIKHFEMALDERYPEQRRRLETRFWIAASPTAHYGVSYRWNDEQTDAELIADSQTEMLSITLENGESRVQPYFFPGSADCQSCHNAQAGFVIGLRAAQLNRPLSYQLDRPAANQLIAWSAWGLLDSRIGTVAAASAPQLAELSDGTRTLQDRVRSYWDGNCSMCHAGSAGSVPGWDARYSTPFEEQGLEQPPVSMLAAASHLIARGSPDDSLIYLRGATAESPLRMPPVGRSRVDDAYVDVLRRWIESLAE